MLPLMGMAAQQTSAPVQGYRVVASYPHDPQAYTQGLVYRDGFLYESTGQRGRSDLRKVRLRTGEVVRKVALADRFFGEGLAIWRGRLIQLTWEAGTGFVYDLASFHERGTFSYEGEGWGLTHDRRHLIMSDGSATLRFIDPGSFEVVRRVQVHDGATRIDDLNELEYIRGEIYANVWQTDRIARIDPDSGRVNGWIDLSGLLQDSGHHGVLNGIAFDARHDRLFVTGKQWPRLFEIEPTAP
jgi:glutaminyl-peptide cyclotransferase